MKLGKHQIQTLWALGRPGMWQVVGNGVSRSLQKRGLVAPKFPDDQDAFLGITPTGLRALADAMESGQLEKFTKLEPRKTAAA